MSAVSTCCDGSAVAIAFLPGFFGPYTLLSRGGKSAEGSVTRSFRAARARIGSAQQAGRRDQDRIGRRIARRFYDVMPLFPQRSQHLVGKARLNRDLVGQPLMVQPGRGYRLSDVHFVVEHVDD